MDGVVIKGLDLFDIVGFIMSKNRKFIAIWLNELESIFENQRDIHGELPEEFYLVRKLYLDGQNNYTRSILRAVFGDVEHLMGGE